MVAAPKLRDDLVIRSQATGTGTTIVVKDPAARRFFRFGEAEHFIAQQLDGITPLDEVRRRVEERFGQPLREETLRRFIEQFRRFRLLDDAEARDDHQHGEQGRLRGSLLYIRLKAFDPDRFLDWLVPRLDFVFTRSFLVCTTLMIVIALGVTVANWTEFVRDVSRLYRFDALLLAWITVLSVTTAHEFAHGVTCKRFGGEVDEIGFLLLYFQPAFYCNVSDAWLIPKKSNRLWITFAGAYLEISVWAGATLLWRITETDTRLNFAALVIMATSGIKSLFNLNPLIKLDGYYLLSDYLEIPNLRRKSIAALKSRVRALSNLSADALRIRSREDRIYLAYGALAVVYSTWLLSIVALRFGSYLVNRYRGAGFIAFAGLLLMAFQRPLGNAFARAPHTVDTAPPRKRFTIRRWRLPLIAVMLAVVALIPMELKVAGDFRILPRHDAEVRTQVDGILAEIYKDEGERVEKGDVIARLDDREFRSELQKIEAQVAESEARRDMLRAGPRREEIELARSERDTARVRQEHGQTMFEDAGRVRAAEIAKTQTSVEKAEQRLRFARSELERLERMFAAELVARTSVEQAQQEVAVCQKELEEARAAATMVRSDNSADAHKERDLATQEFSRAEGRLHVLLAGSRPEEIKAIDAEIARLHAQRSYLEQQLHLVDVSSPAAGVIATPRLKDRIGERVTRGDLIAKVFGQSTVTAEIRVSEKEIADVHVGQTVAVKARAFPEKSFLSRITAIAPVAIEDEGGLGGRVIRVMTDIDNRAGLLKPEMTGNAKIYCGPRRVFDVATRRIARYIRVEFWSWW
jgi:putative peptide zinc metalloprotease protein